VNFSSVMTQNSTPAGATGAAPVAVEAPVLKTWGKIVRIGGRDNGVTVYAIAGRHVDRDVFDLIIRVDKEDTTTEEHYGTFDSWKLVVDVGGDVARDVVAGLLAGALFSRAPNVEVVHSDVYYAYHDGTNIDMYYIRADNVLYIVDSDGEVYNLGTLRDAEEIPEEFGEEEKEVIRKFIRAVREIVICAFCL